MEEMALEPQEIKMISTERTSLIPTEPKRDPAPIRKKRDRMVCWLIRALAGSLTMNMLQWVIIYILQAGPI